jgi:hypothetical protein
MSLIYLTSNEVTSASATGGDTEDTLFPASNLGSGDPAEMFRFNAAGTDDFRYVDLGTSTSCNFASVHFHNIDSGVTAVQIQSDDNSGFSSPNTRATMTVRKPAFYATWGAASERYWRIRFVGTNATPIYIGEWWLGTSVAFTRNQKWKWKVAHQMLQQRTGGFPNRIRATNFGDPTFPTRRLSMNFLPISASDRDEGLTLLNSSTWGSGPIAIVPDDSDSIVIHGRVDNNWSWTVDEGGLFPYSMAINEDPGPVLVT